MKDALRRRFWLEAGVATLTGVMFVITLVWRNWVEIIFGVDPDQGNGLLEWSIVGALFLATVVLVVLARYEWRKAQTSLA